jgi:hypothetical protein
MEIIKIKGEILLTRRKWWQLFKLGWHKHENIGGKWWIKFNWTEEEDRQAIFHMTNSKFSKKHSDIRWVTYRYSEAFTECDCGKPLMLTNRSFNNPAYTGQCDHCGKKFKLLNKKIYEINNI